MACRIPFNRPLVKKQAPAWPLAAGFYGGLCVVALVGAPAAVGIVLLVAWLVAVAAFNRDPARVLFTALVVGGVAAVMRDVAGLSDSVLSLPFAVVACLAIYLAHDHA